MATIFLPIKPVYANRILDGSKVYEYRKTVPKKDVSHIVIYASSPWKKIVGVAKVDEILSAPVKELWEQTNGESGISPEGYFKYFEGRDVAYAYRFARVRKITKILSPFDLWDDFHIPQSFRYLQSDSFNDVYSLKYEYV